jgi:hypothetical protein
MAEETKKWYLSKTLWANALVIAAAFATQLAELVSSGVAVSAVAVLNLVLRIFTSTKLK